MSIQLKNINKIYNKGKKNENHVLKDVSLTINDGEMEQLQGNKVATLSGGEKQRTAIARALVKNPEYILADEPTGSLDTENAEIFMENLIHLHEMGKTIIMVTHDLELASRLNRTCRIVDGELIAE